MIRIVILSIALLPLIGCGPKRTLRGGAVSGKITYKGQPVNGALLRFYPIPGPDPEVPPIAVKQDGTFLASTIPPGDYKIVVEPSQGPPRGMGGGMPPMQGMDPAKAAEMKQKLTQVQGEMPAPTIPFPNKYKRLDTTDLKQTIVQGEQTMDLELKD
jgi:hypothetical protein